ncbi:MAG: alkaline phosphatase, partial [Cutibacterium avidum]|nr:alkaline phosphatase [Cutibacterium avidum]
AKLAEAKDVDLLVTDDSADPDELTRLRALGIAIRIVHASTD